MLKFLISFPKKIAENNSNILTSNIINKGVYNFISNLNTILLVIYLFDLQKHFVT